MAKKPKLSKNQQRQIAKNRRTRLEAKSGRNTQDNALLGELTEGRVVSRFGKQAIVETMDEARALHKCFIRRTIKSVVCGDAVVFRPSLSNEERDRGIVEIVHDRKTTLSRPDYYDGVKPIAANIDQIIVVSAVLPAFSAHIIDRYIVACEQARMPPVIVVNKIEILSPEEKTKLIEDLKVYRDIGYKVLLLSCKTREGISDIANILIDKVNVLVGQSGVGKSSIINELLPGSDESIGAVSTNSGLGQHTTTAAKLLPFDLGGELIDSPGVREFGLWHLKENDITEGFVEFREFLGACKFKDCKHKNDPGCLITQAVKDGKINAQRYESYLKIIESLEQNRPSYIKQ